MTDQPFVHLHVHTEYSLLDGLSRIDKLVGHANDMGMKSLAITDHGTMFGVVDFYRACKAADIKPIIGVESYLSKRGMTDRDPKEDRKPYHMLLLAKNQTGYQNLLKIASAGQLQGYYYNPRIDRDFLAAHSEGLIATSGCLAAQIPNAVMAGRDDEARQHIGWYLDVFGKENFFLELQQHNIEELKLVNNWLIANRDYADVQLVATNDVHYVLDSDYDPHDTLLCIQTGSLKHETNRLKMSDASYHLKSQAEMWRDFGHIRDGEALLSTLKIAEMCEVNLDSKGYHLPVFPVPEGFDSSTYMRHLCEKGLRWRYGSEADNPDVRGRLDRELGIIHDMGFETYFLIVWDLCQFARHADIWWNVRGSGAGSVAAYSLGITNIDPIQNNLLFERFLNPGRVSMPDIDLDYPDDRREEMIAYTARKYGEDKVASIITFGTLGAKAAVRDVGRALGMPLELVNQAARLIPTEPKPKPVKQYVEDNPELKQLYEKNPEVRKVVDIASHLQGVNRHASTHAAGVIVGDKPLVEYIPLHRPTKGDDENNPLKAVTQFPMETCESLGLLKIDFLGLSTLTIMRKACDLIERYHGIKYTMDNIPYRPTGDPKQDQMLKETFELIGRGDTVGIFQVESTGMQQMLRDMRPKRFEHIIAAVSLYRPGPMDFIPQYNRRLRGEEEPQYKHELLRPILEETYSIIVYQEQLMQIAQQLFGYELGEADLMRRAVSKKKDKDLKLHRDIFLERGPQNGVSPEIASEIFDEIEFFANYGFNKCVTYDTEIVDADTGRVVKIGDLAAGKAQVEHTLTCDLDTLKLQPGKITAVMQNGVKPVYRLTTQSGRSIDATDNHPFYTFDGWRMLGQLAVGEQIAVPRRLPVLIGEGAMHCAPTGTRDMGWDGRISGSPLQQTSTVEMVAESDLDWDAIISIEYMGEEMTYDLTIEGTHNFIANDILVHNSHAADYAVITCQTAYLKAHYPAEYVTALLSVHRSDIAKITTFLGEARRLGIPVLSPDVNYSALDFDIQKQPDGVRGIRFGLAAIKNAGVAPLQHIIDVRNEGGVFTDLEDFCRRVDLRLVQKRTLESLAMVGALKAFGTRSQLIASLDRMVNFSADHHRAEEVGQMNMFGEATGFGSDMLNLPNVEEASEREMLGWEKDLLGLYVTGRPVDKYKDFLQHAKTADIYELKESENLAQDRSVTVAGEVVSLRKVVTKNQDVMGIVDLEDWHDTAGTISVVLFPRTWLKFQSLINEGQVIIVSGKVDASRGDMQIVADMVRQNADVIVPDEEQSFVGSSVEPPAWASDDYFDEETGEAVRLQPQPEPELAAAVAPATQGGAALPMPSIEPQLAPAAKPANGEPAWLHDGDEVLPESNIEVEVKVDHKRWLMIYFQRSDDSEKDRRRLQRVHGILVSYPGEDRFTIVIEDTQQSFKMEFPNHTTAYCESLMEDLLRVVGERNIEVFDGPQ